jgi:hypothetical protein
MGSLDDLIRDLRKFEGRKEVVKQLRKEIRKPVPAVRRVIKRRARTTLPKSGRLNKWAASTRITVKIKLAGRAAGVQLKGGRNSTGGRSDIKRLDKGRLRHPSWGRRGRGQWHTQDVMPGFFTSPATEIDQWRDAALKAVDEALEVIRRGR